jgi:hypothetical protein
VFGSTINTPLYDISEYEHPPTLDSVFNYRRRSCFVKSNALLCFLSRIGRRNAGFLTDINVKGEFKAYFEDYDSKCLRSQVRRSDQLEAELSIVEV